MKLLTPKEVKAYATTPKRAVAMSKKHWAENKSYTLAELKMYYDESPSNALDPNLCGLCVYYEEVCSDCLLGDIETRCAEYGSLYYLADLAYEANNEEAWAIASKNMWRKLVELEKKQT